MSILLKLGDKDIFPNVHTLLLIGATLPVTTCECERSFSCLRRLNSYLRSTQSSSRLDALALIHIHCEEEINPDVVIDRFSKAYPTRMELGNVLLD